MTQPASMCGIVGVRVVETTRPKNQVGFLPKHQMTPATLTRPGVRPNPQGGFDMQQRIKIGKPHRPTTSAGHAHAIESTETWVGKRIKPQPNGCWLWRGKPNRYGEVKIAGTLVYVHRYVYETLVGPIPDGHHIHHTCETLGCCNPAHLRAVTPGEHRRIHA